MRQQRQDQEGRGRELDGEAQAEEQPGEGVPADALPGEDAQAYQEQQHTGEGQVGVDGAKWAFWMARAAPAQKAAAGGRRPAPELARGEMTSRMVRVAASAE